MLAAIRKAVGRAGTGVSRVWCRGRAEWRLKHHLSRLSDREVDLALADAGLSRGDLSTVLRAGNARHGLMTRTMAHFGVDPKAAALRYWRAFRDAERVCAHCTNVKRCRRWHDWGVSNDAPRMFCPNARLFDEMARNRRRDTP